MIMLKIPLMMMLFDTLDIMVVVFWEFNAL